MTLYELKSLRQGEYVVLTKVDEKICEYHNHQLIFYELSKDIDGIILENEIVSFFRNSLTISNFSYEICHYIERKITLERENKLNKLGI
jgi:hypothetical protein